MRKKDEQERLSLWQERHRKAKAAYRPELDQMDEREKLYAGDETIHQIVCRDFKDKTCHVRNIVAEIIEAQVNSTIPQPKVTAKRKEDEPLAQIIEDMLRNEIDRLPFERMNDQTARTVPIQGGAGMLVEWDESKQTHTTAGELDVTELHPKWIIPQDGVLSGVEDMDYIFIEVPQTKESIRMKYGRNVYKESEENPGIRGQKTQAAEMVTQIIAYFRNDRGGIGRFSWVGETVLEDLDNYQARRIRKCAKCGAVEPMEYSYTPTGDDETDVELAQTMYLKATKPRAGSGKKECPFCGGTKFELDENDYEVLDEPVFRSDGTMINPYEISETINGTDELGNPIRTYQVKQIQIPYYTPNEYPLVLIKNVSMHGKFLGSSDVDMIAYQQNTENRLNAKITDKLMKSGSYITLPIDAEIREDGEDAKVIRLDNVAKKDYIGVFDMEGNISQDMAFRDAVYNEARQIIGITDSFQGRSDPTATSGKAKEFAAAQSAGRLESKRVMRDWAFSELYRKMFLWKLSYTDEPRPVVSRDAKGNAVYSEFNRYDFLRQDAMGNFYWVDDFIFSTDVAATLASNREAMWQETRLNFQQGAFGNPQDPRTLILFWTKMAALHYPGAEDTKTELQEMMQQETQLQQTQMMNQMPGQIPEIPEGAAPEETMELPPNMMQAIENMARERAMQDTGYSE